MTIEWDSTKNQINIEKHGMILTMHIKFLRIPLLQRLTIELIIEKKGGSE